MVLYLQIGLCGVAVLGVVIIGRSIRIVSVLVYLLTVLMLS